MWLIKLAWKNIWRNKARTQITIAAIFFSVVLSTLTESLKKGVFDNLVKNIVSFYTGYIQIHKKGYFKEQVIDNAFERSAAIEYETQQDINIEAIAPRLESFALASAGSSTKGCMVVGILPESEDKVTLLKSKMTSGNYLKTKDRAVLIGEGLAQQLLLKTDDTIILIGQGYHGTVAAGKYKIKGIVKFGSPQLNNKILYMGLQEAQDFFSARKMITTYSININNTKKLKQSAAIINKIDFNLTEPMLWRREWVSN